MLLKMYLNLFTMTEDLKQEIRLVFLVLPSNICKWHVIFTNISRLRISKRPQLYYRL